MTDSVCVKPSISLRIWLSVCSRSSCPPPTPAPRWRPTASISSMKRMAGAFSLAVLNRSRTRPAPTPTNIWMNSEPLIEKKGTPASPATARPSSVLPVPGGPISRMPLGTRAAEPLELGRIAEELDDLLQVVLDAFQAGDVGEGDRLVAGVVAPGAALGEAAGQAAGEERIAGPAEQEHHSPTNRPTDNQHVDEQHDERVVGRFRRLVIARLEPFEQQLVQAPDRSGPSAAGR